MNRLRTAILLLTLPLVVGACASYNAYTKAHAAEETKNWDEAVMQYEKALQIDPNNLRYKVDLQRAKLEASRVHFEKGKSLRAAAAATTGSEQLRLAQLAATELELVVRLDSTNQYAAVELGKVVQIINEANRLADKNSIDAMKRRVNVTKAQPPQLNPASDQPISLSFPKETPVKDIYRALGNAFGINVLFDQAVKNDPISIELKDVTAQQALERVMQAANHFYKVLDEHTIIVIPDNPQARRDYEDLVIRTFYLSNGDAEQVTNVVRTMLEARNVFPLKALNAITIRDTADRVRIAEKIIEANDKAKAEVVVDVELLQLVLTKEQDIGAFVAGTSGSLSALTPTTTVTTGTGGATTTVTEPVTFKTLRNLTNGSWTFTMPTVNYGFLKNMSDAQTLANPELRISEGEKATLHIGSRVPVPIASFQSIGANASANGVYSPTVSFQYQDIGIKVAIEPRVHHNREVTLKLTVEVSDLGPKANVAGQDLPTFVTRTIEDTIRLKDGETNFLAGLIQTSDTNSDQKTPFLGDIPFIGRLFTENTHSRARTDLMLTMTPHIIRIPDITEEDLAPMWVGTQNNMTFRGVSPRLESQTATDPFAPSPTDQFATPTSTAPADQGTMVAPAVQPNSLRKPMPVAPNPPQSNNSLAPGTTAPASTSPKMPEVVATAAITRAMDDSMAGRSPRIAPQPERVSLKPGEEKAWTVFGMDLDNLTTNQITMHYDPRALDMADVSIGSALKVDPSKPPVIKVDRDNGTVTITSSTNAPLVFASGGEIATLHVRGGLTGDTYLVIENPNLQNGRGETVASAVAGGHANVE